MAEVNEVKVKKVAIVGGTHGNERNGVYLAKTFLREPETVKRPSFETTVLLANTDAIEKNLRYIDEDLNRCFSHEALATHRETKEYARAAEIHKLLGPKGSDASSDSFDMVFDMHNTTANTGVVLMMRPTDLFSIRLATYLQQKDASVRICLWAKHIDPAMLPSVSKHGMTVEVGPVSWGCLDAALFAQTRRLIMHALDFLEQTNATPEVIVLPKQVVVFGREENVEYVRDADGELISMIPAELQGADFTKLISEGDTLLVGFEEGAPPCKRYEGKRALYPFFVSEAAYYEKNIAFMLCDRYSVDLVTGEVALCTSEGGSQPE